MGQVSRRIGVHDAVYRKPGSAQVSVLSLSMGDGYPVNRELLRIFLSVGQTCVKIAPAFGNILTTITNVYGEGGSLTLAIINRRMNHSTNKGATGNITNETVGN